MRRSWPGLIITLVIAACTTEGVTPVTTSTVPVTSTTPSTITTLATDTTTVDATTTTSDLSLLAPEELVAESFPIPAGSGIHDVAPGLDGAVWYTAQASGELGWLDPANGETRHIDLGPGSSPHGVITDEEGTPWVTDTGLNAIVRVDPATLEVTTYPLPADRNQAGVHTATFNTDGSLWFTGQSGVVGRLDPVSGEMEILDTPEGRGPYGITATPGGVVYYASLSGSYVGEVREDGTISVLEPPTPDQGARRVWSDSMGRIWVSEWNSGNVSRYTPGSDTWETWKLPGDNPQAYAVFVDDQDIVWLSDFGSNTVVRFHPGTEEFHSIQLPSSPGDVRQINGRPGEVWLPESATDNLVLLRTVG